MTTQKDIAKKLGISISLVSRVLAGKGEEIGASAETMRKVKETAEEMSYIPNLQAQILKGAPTRTIGVVVYDFEDPFFGRIIGELHNLAKGVDYSLVLTGFEQRKFDERSLKPLLKHHIEGLIILGSEDVMDWTWQFTEKKIPTVRVGSGPTMKEMSVVCVDEQEGMRSLLNHLRELGHKTVGYIGGSQSVHQRRHKIFADLLSECGLRTKDNWHGRSSSHITDAGVDATRSLLSRAGADLPTALVASSDLLAVGAIRCLAEHKLAVPGEMSVVGFDDIPLARMTTPSLTTVSQPAREMADQAFALASGGAMDDESGVIRIAPELKVRESTGPFSG